MLENVRIPESVLDWRARQKEGAIMSPATFRSIKRTASQRGYDVPEAVAGKTYWITVLQTYLELYPDDQGAKRALNAMLKSRSYGRANPKMTPIHRMGEARRTEFLLDRREKMRRKHQEMLRRYGKKRGEERWSGWLLGENPRTLRDMAEKYVRYIKRMSEEDQEEEIFSLRHTEESEKLMRRFPGLGWEEADSLRRLILNKFGVRVRRAAGPHFEDNPSHPKDILAIYNAYVKNIKEEFDPDDWDKYLGEANSVLIRARTPKQVVDFFIGQTFDLWTFSEFIKRVRGLSYNFRSMLLGEANLRESEWDT